MKIIVIPPYLNAPITGHFADRELLDTMAERGQLEGVEVDIDEGYPTEWNAEARDAEFIAEISPGAVKKVKEYSKSGKYDAIVYSSGLDPGFFASRVVSNIPVAGAQHSAVHVASLIGERIAIICPMDAINLVRRQYIQNYGLNHKIVCVRAPQPEKSSTYLMGYTRKFKKEERVKLPEIKTLLDNIMKQCVAAIEDDRADCLILGGPQLQIYEEQIRQGLDEAGYSEIPLVCEFSAAIEMAKVMVNMKLKQAPRAYPDNALKAKPQTR